MKIFLLLLPILLLTACSPKLVKNDNNDLPVDEPGLAQQFIKLIENDDRKKLSERILYPLSRKHPLEPVVDKSDFLKRYDEIFDPTFRNLIVSSDPENDWESVGARGVMFNSGELWIDFSGSLFAVNYQSEAEKAKAAAIMIRDNQDLHESVRVFEKPVLEMKTKGYQVRVDNLGGYNFRYTAWSIDKETTSEPDLILTDGVRYPEGSGGNHRFEFKNGKYRYEVFVIRLGEKDSPPAVLNVYNGYEKVVTEEATYFKN